MKAGTEEIALDPQGPPAKQLSQAQNGGEMVSWAGPGPGSSVRTGLVALVLQWPRDGQWHHVAKPH